MESNLIKILSSLTLVAAWAYSLGWIKTFYYLRSFGIGLESVEYTVQDYLFASWYVIENVMFFVLLLWIAAISSLPLNETGQTVTPSLVSLQELRSLVPRVWEIAQRKWVYAVVLLYLPIPYLTDWSYSHLSSPTWGWLCELLVNIPHSILKFVPFLILGVVILNKERRTTFKEATWPHGSFALVVLSLVAIAWSVSAAKHFGTSDANFILRNPAKTLLHVKLRISDNAPNLKPIESRQSLYLLYYSVHRCILIDTTGFNFGQTGARLTIFYVPSEKVEMIEGLKNAGLDPGRLFW